MSLKRTSTTTAILAFLVAFLLPAKPAISGELFGKIEARYRSAAQTEIEFLHIVISEFFDTADTVKGKIVFDTSGNYNTTLGTDKFIFDGKCLWEYSGLYGQATKNCLQTGKRIDDSFLFFTRFSDYYTITETSGDSLYSLKILPEKKGSAPDSLMVMTSKSESRILELLYYDINEELNIARLLNERYFDAVDSLAFLPVFPDSTEMIEIHE